MLQIILKLSNKHEIFISATDTNPSSLGRNLSMKSFPAHSLLICLHANIFPSGLFAVRTLLYDPSPRVLPKV